MFLPSAKNCFERHPRRRGSRLGEFQSPGRTRAGGPSTGPGADPCPYHERTALAIVCPITSISDPYPFKVTLPEGLAIAGAVLADQAKSIDRAARQLRIAGRAPHAVLAEVQGKLAALLGVDRD
jgi:mRNA interferase MazF